MLRLNGLLIIGLTLALATGCASRSTRALSLTRETSSIAGEVSSIADASCRREQQSSLIATVEDPCQVVASSIEYPDVERCQATETLATLAPRRMQDGEPTEFWDITLTEVIRLGLTHTEVLRDLRGRVLEIPDNVPSVYDVAILMSHPRFGEEAALAAFDAQLSQSFMTINSDRPFNNATLGGGAFEVQRDNLRWDWQLAKTAATGTQFGLRTFWDHDHNDSPANLFSHAWSNGVEATVRQPLLQGGGVAFNRIAGPSNRTSLGVARGVLLARVDGDISLADFERGVRDYVDQLEDAYWELHFAYRELDANRMARDAARNTWQTVQARNSADLKGGEADTEAQAREQMFLFEQQVTLALEGAPNVDNPNGLYRRERQLRRLLGLPVNDGLLMRPADEPTDARVEFDWESCMGEAVVRRVEIRRQLWRVKQRELELIAARNFLLPRLDAIAGYRIEGLGDDLIGANDQFQSAFHELFSFQHYEAQAGLQMSVPLGYRAEMAGVRHAELQLRRARAILDDQENSVIHHLAEAIAALSGSHANIDNTHQRLLAAEEVVGARTATFEAGRGSIDALLEAQRRLADARIAFHRARTDHMLAIKQVHLQKGTLLGYDGVQLTEGHPETEIDEQFAKRLAQSRERTLDYRFSDPEPVSRGSVDHAISDPSLSDP